MIDYLSSFSNTNGAAFPDTLAVNATGVGATDGTEFVKAFIDDLWGARQALMAWAGLTPDTITEAPGTAQTIEAMRKGFNIGPGFVVPYFHTSSAITGFRILPLNGQGVLIASYPDLTAATYVGDGNNNTVHSFGGAFYKASDAAGTTPDTAGPYLILPETRGYVPRGLDTAATVDPLGASRFLGDNQVDAMQGHFHGYELERQFTVNSNTGTGTTPFAIYNYTTVEDIISDPNSILKIQEPITDGVNGTPRTSSETRMSNFSIQWGITY